MKVSNTGSWIEPAAVAGEKDKNGFGHAILKERLERLYSSDHSFDIGEDSGWVRVKVCLPLGMNAEGYAPLLSAHLVQIT